MIRLARRGKGQALTLAERQLEPGPLLLCDADIRGDLRPLAESEADLAIAAFRTRAGGGFGLAKRRPAPSSGCAAASRRASLSPASAG